jgi:hypothetical protein
MYFPPSTECRKLAEYDPTMRFGLSLSARGSKLFIAKQMNPDEVGRADEERQMYQHVARVFGLQGLFNKDGRLEGIESKPGRAVIWRWLDDDEGPFTAHGAFNGDLVAFLRYHAVPQEVAERQRYEAALAQGAEFQAAVDDGSAAHGDMWRYAARNDVGMTRKIIDKEDFKRGLRDPRNARLKSFLEGDNQKFKNLFVDRYGLRRPS